MIRVEGHKNLFRDENTNAIISKDEAGYQAVSYTHLTLPTNREV